MLDYRDLLSIPFYKKSAYTGSLDGTRYRIEKVSRGEGDGQTDYLQLSIWNGPFAYDKTAPDTISHKLFDFSKNGLIDIADYLNNMNRNDYDT